MSHAWVMWLRGRAKGGYYAAGQDRCGYRDRGDQLLIWERLTRLETEQKWIFEQAVCVSVGYGRI